MDTTRERDLEALIRNAAGQDEELAELLEIGELEDLVAYGYIDVAWARFGHKADEYLCELREQEGDGDRVCDASKEDPR